MNQSFSTPVIVPPKRIVAVPVARGGIRPTLWMTDMLEELLPILTHDLHVSSQRQDIDGQVKAKSQSKGVTVFCPDTVGLVVEGVIASGTTGEELIELVRKTCGGRIERFIFASIGAVREGIERIQQAFPNSQVVTLLLHGRLNGHAYTEGPGTWDHGVLDAWLYDSFEAEVASGPRVISAP